LIYGIDNDDDPIHNRIEHDLEADESIKHLDIYF